MLLCLSPKTPCLYSIARLGSVLNDILTPYIWSRSNVPSAFWGGFVSCIISFMTACLLAWLDRRYESVVMSGFSRVPTHPTDGRFSLEARDTGVGPTNVSRYDPPMAAANKSRRAITSTEVIGMESLESRRPLSVDGLEESGITSSDDSEDSSRESVDHRSSQDPMVRDRVPSRTSIRSRGRTNGTGNGSSSSARVNCLRILKPVCDYSQSSWVIFLMTLLMVGVQVPFNSIHAGFLQMRWYHNDPQKGKSSFRDASFAIIFFFCPLNLLRTFCIWTIETCWTLIFYLVFFYPHYMHPSSLITLVSACVLFVWHGCMSIYVFFFVPLPQNSRTNHDSSRPLIRDPRPPRWILCGSLWPKVMALHVMWTDHWIVSFCLGDHPRSKPRPCPGCPGDRQRYRRHVH